MERLTQRADFLAAAKGRRVAGGAMVLTAHVRKTSAPPRFGFTVSKKVGNAVERNRVRRRLREIVRRHAALLAQSGHDYVLIGRRAALQMPFERMVAEFTGALTRLHGERRGRGAAESNS
jgi:ribonuclease P protein component